MLLLQSCFSFRPVMTFYYFIILLAIWPHSEVRGYEAENAETNIEMRPPIYETIIFGDVADILNEFDNMNSPLEAMVSGSESDENIEDLLTEYQLYLDKAHKQKMDFIEKNKVNTKNKVPPLRHEKYIKNNPGRVLKNDNMYYNSGFHNPSIIQSNFGNPLDIFPSSNTKGSSPLNNFVPAAGQIATSPFNPLDIFFPMSHKLPSPLDILFPGSQKVSKFLKDISLVPSKGDDEELTSYGRHTNIFSIGAQQPKLDQLKTNPKKPCKMCMMARTHDDTMNPTYMLQKQISLDGDNKNEQNALNIRIKVDIQLPKAQDSFGKNINNRSQEDGDSKETSLSVPFPYLNFPIPMNLLGFKKSAVPKYNKHDLVHHKKRFRMSNNNKKHKKNMKFPWFNISASQLLEPLSFRVYPRYEETLNFKDLLKKENDSYQHAFTNETTPVYVENSKSKLNDTDLSVQKNESNIELANINETISTEKNIYVMVNISSVTGNATDEAHKENSVETDFTTVNSNLITKEKSTDSQRVRRHVSTNLTEEATVTVNVAKHEDAVEEVTTIVKQASESQTDGIKEVTTASVATVQPADAIKEASTDSIATEKQSDAVKETTTKSVAKVKRAVTATIADFVVKQADATKEATTGAIATEKQTDTVKEVTTDAVVTEKRADTIKEATTDSVATVKQAEAVKEATTTPVDISKQADEILEVTTKLITKVKRSVSTKEPITDPAVEQADAVKEATTESVTKQFNLVKDPSTDSVATVKQPGAIKEATTNAVDVEKKTEVVKELTTESVHKVKRSVSDADATTVSVNIAHAVKEATSAPVKVMIRQEDAIRRIREHSTGERVQDSESVKIMDMKKSEKVLSVDKELTLWPENTIDKIAVASVIHNITTIIVEREKQKAKLNLTKETIRNNRTKALEKAIFGDVNWDDVDTVAPVFMSFVGKYINGVLTFCSENVCHSMKCAEQTCVHRICKPEERWNQRGHCGGSNRTDSVASMQSIMDLPSNVGFEIVEILQEKMLGKMYGSVTLCISSKCVSFITSKMNFMKSKCSAKDLNTAGQCPTAKKSRLT